MGTNSVWHHQVTRSVQETSRATAGRTRAGSRLVVHQAMGKLAGFLREQAFLLFLPCLWPLWAVHAGAPAHPFLPKETWWHYGMAFCSATIFLGLIHITFRGSRLPFWNLVYCAAVVGTIGVALLLTFQWLAEWAVAHEVSNSNWMVAGLKVIGHANRVVQHSGSLPLPLVLFGFVVGIGLCEEACKASFVEMPNDWRTACKQGLACGVGFGVAEGLYYSGKVYNGEAGMETYVVRFMACVALHALLSGGVAISLAHSSHGLWKSKATFVKVLLVPMLIHGLYDTFATFGMKQPADLCVGSSFAWLLILILYSRTRDRIARAKPTFYVSR